MAEVIEDWPAKVGATERQLRLAGISVRRLCEEADVHVSSWHRWKGGEADPSRRSWSAIEAALESLEVPKKAAAAVAEFNKGETT